MISQNYIDSIEVIRANQSLFRADFESWIVDNGHVAEAFISASDKVWDIGIRHYSARAIMEVIRHRSNIREISGEYKINNNQIPDLARLYVLLNPDRASIFSFRSSDIREAA